MSEDCKARARPKGMCLSQTPGLPVATATTATAATVVVPTRAAELGRDLYTCRYINNDCY